MWLATKEAARRREQRETTPKIPPISTRQRELGNLDEAIKYGRLFDAHPDVPIGPDEDIQHHYNRLKAAELERGEQNPDRERRAQDPQLKQNRPADAPKSDASWVTGPPIPTDLKGMPQRIPGWFTGDAMDAPPPGYGVPPMSKRNPGSSVPLSERSPASSYAPNQQSIQDWVSNTHGASPEQRGSQGQQSIKDWVSWLRDKGITVNQALQRPDAVNNQVPPPPRPTGHDIWAPFVPRGLGATEPPPQNSSGIGSLIDKTKNLFRSRRTASTVVSEYIEGVLIDLGDMIKIASVHDTMTGDGWAYHESGSGNWYQKKIGDKVHVIVRQPDGWIHNSGPAENEMTGAPVMFDDLQGAVMRANRGQAQVGFRPPPVNQQSLSSTSWSDEG